MTEAADTEVCEVEITAPAKTAAEDIAAAMKRRDFVRARSTG